MSDQKQEFKLVPVDFQEYFKIAQINMWQVAESFSTDGIVIRLIYTGDDVTYHIAFDKIKEAADALASGKSTRGMLDAFQYYLLVCLLKITKHETSMPVDDDLEPNCGCAHTVDKIIAWRGRIFKIQGSQHDLYWTDPEFPAMFAWRLSEFVRLLCEIRHILPRTFCKVDRKWNAEYQLDTKLFKRKTPRHFNGDSALLYADKLVKYSDAVLSCIVELPKHLAELGVKLDLYEPGVVRIIVDFLRDADYVQVSEE